MAYSDELINTQRQLIELQQEWIAALKRENEALRGTPTERSIAEVREMLALQLQANINQQQGDSQ